MGPVVHTMILILKSYSVYYCNSTFILDGRTQGDLNTGAKGVQLLEYMDFNLHQHCSQRSINV